MSEADEFLALDNQNINVAKLENERNHAKKVFRQIIRKFPSKANFEIYFKEYIQNLNDETASNEQIFSKDQLKDFIIGFFEKNPAEKIQKRDIEGFLTNFTYNKHGETAVLPIPSLIYELFIFYFEKCLILIFSEEDKEYFKRLGYKNYGPIPSKKKRFNKDFLKGSNSTEGDILLTEFSEKSASDLFKVKRHHRTTENKQLQSILQKIEEKYFSGTNTALKIFRSFDIDNDGLFK